MNITKQFYSNCLFEAFNAKAKNHTVKIMYVPAHLNEIFCPHFMWTDDEYEYDFGTSCRLKPWEIIFFRGTIRRREIGFYDGYMMRLKQYRRQR